MAHIRFGHCTMFAEEDASISSAASVALAATTTSSTRTNTATTPRQPHLFQRWTSQEELWRVSFSVPLLSCSSRRPWHSSCWEVVESALPWVQVGLRTNREKQSWRIRVVPCWARCRKRDQRNAYQWGTSRMAGKPLTSSRDCTR